MFFQCSTTDGIPSLQHQTIVSPPPISTIHHDIKHLRERLGYFRQTRHEKTMDALYSRLEEYYPKNISYTEDIVKAFLGTVSAVDIPNDAGNILATQIYGLPVFYAENSSTSPKDGATARQRQHPLSHSVSAGIQLVTSRHGMYHRRGQASFRRGAGQA
jgi:hypothetical protein